MMRPKKNLNELEREAFAGMLGAEAIEPHRRQREKDTEIRFSGFYKDSNPASREYWGRLVGHKSSFESLESSLKEMWRDPRLLKRVKKMNRARYNKLSKKLKKQTIQPPEDEPEINQPEDTENVKGEI